MKTCPQCDQSYPDSETFCATDGTALVPAGPAFVQRAHQTMKQPVSEAGGRITCPSCGGSAEPGEVYCNFCGHRLTDDQPAPQPSVTGSGRTSTTQPRQPQSSSRQFTGQIPDSEPQRSGVLVALGYIVAAVVALGGGAWLALHLSQKAPAPEANASPAASASSAATPEVAADQPLVVLAQGIPIQVTGDSASAPDRSQDAARKVFDPVRGQLLDAYRTALASDSTLRDGMILKVRVMPDGSVGAAAVQTSTASNPGLDADVVKDASALDFGRTSGGEVETSFPVIFARNDAERQAVEQDLKTKMASVNPAEPPEYGSAPAPSPAAAPPSPAVAAVEPTPAVAPPPSASAPAPSTEAALAPVPAPAVTKPRPHRHYAAPKPPPPSLLDQVQAVLKTDRRLGRVKAYTNGSTVTLYGKVYDDNAKLIAQRKARSVPGVSGVNDTLTTDVAQWAAEQSQIQQQLANAGLPNVTVKVIGNDAYLNGSVKTNMERQRAETIVVGAAPVTVRANLIRVEPGSMFGF